LDGDCDGAVDESYEDLGQMCDNGDIGSCRDMGVKICDPQDPSQTICDFSQPPDPDPLAPRPEECNGADDNCDGIIDNSDPADPDRVIDDMVHVQRSGLDFWIYRYEASRPDATETSAGGSDVRACSKQGALPWGGATYAQAEAACQAVGKRLCSPAEWLAACAGSSGLSYPYGDTYDGEMCNGRDLDGIPGGDDDNILLPAGDTGLLSGCVSEDSVHDMSGNLREWTTEQSGDTGDPDYTPIYVVRGGDYTTPEPGLGCTFTLSQAVADVILPTIGFRCCSDTAP
jgi:formylglycine-generating enzyme required for sulfatase activity